MPFIRLFLVFCAIFWLPRMRTFSIACIVTVIAFAISSTLWVISIIAFIIMSFKCYIFSDVSRNKYNFRWYDDLWYNKKWYNISWYDMQWYNKKGYDKDGFDKDWRNRYWINKITKTKYNKCWWSKDGENEKTWTRYWLDWYDIDGHDNEWFSRNWRYERHYWSYSYWTNKKTKTLFDERWYDMKWYDKNWFDRWWIHKDTKDYYDKNWLDKNGFNKKWRNKDKINKYTWTKYNKEWFDFYWYDKDWFDCNWLNEDWIDKRGFPHEEDYYTWGWMYEWWKNIYTNTKYDKNWLDYYWNHKETREGTKKSTTKTTNKNVRDSKSKSKTKENIESLKICSIASWSNWNCYYIWTDNESILIDDWISYKQLSLRMNESNLDMNSVKWIFISHEHVDHIRWLPIFYKNHPEVPIYFNEKAYRSVNYSNNPSAYRGWVVNLEEKVVNLWWFKIYPFKKKHDASYPLSFRVEYNWISVWIFTDIWEHSTTFRNHFSKCNAVFLEANHDVTMLRNCSRPRDVIERIYETHFSNDNAYDMLNDYANPNLQVVILAHISEDNNSNRKIMEKFAKFEKKYKLEIASRYGVWKVYNITN